MYNYVNRAFNRTYIVKNVIITDNDDLTKLERKTISIWKWQIQEDMNVKKGSWRQIQSNGIRTQWSEMLPLVAGTPPEIENTHYPSNIVDTQKK